MTMNKDDRPGCRRWRGPDAACAVVAVVVGLSQAVAAANHPMSAARTATRVGVHLADVREAVTTPDFLTSLWNWLIGAAASGCTNELVCGRSNSPVVDGAAIVTSAPLDSAKSVSANPTGTRVGVHLAAVRQRVTPFDFLTSLWDWLFRTSASGCANELLCGRTNSPVIDGAAIVMSEPLGATRSFPQFPDAPPRLEAVWMHGDLVSANPRSSRKD